MTIQVTERLRSDVKARGPLARRSAETLLWRILTTIVFAIVTLLVLLPPTT